MLHGFVTSRYGSCGLLKHDHKEIVHQKQMAHVLWQQRCLEVASRLHHVRVVNETRRTYRHHGRQRDAPRRIATFRHATLCVATHRYATLEPLGQPGGSRAFSAYAALNRLWLRDATAASRRLKSTGSDNGARASPAPSGRPVHAGGPYFGECKLP
jgi:hypothetical protein